MSKCIECGKDSHLDPVCADCRNKAIDNGAIRGLPVVGVRDPAPRPIGFRPARDGKGDDRG